MSKTAKNILFLILSTLVGVGLMGWIYRGFNVRLIADFFALRSNYFWITLTLLVGIVANVLRSLRWRQLLAASGIRISLRRSVELVFISYLVNSVTPRLGELARSLLVRRGNADVTGRALGTVVVEKLADLFCLVLVVGLAVALRWDATVGLVRHTTEGLQWAVPAEGLFLVVACAVCLVIGVSLPLWKHLRRFFRNLWQGISAIARLEHPGRFIALCGGIWVCNFLQLSLLIPCFTALDSLSWADAVHVFAVASVGVLLPTPAGAGPWHFAVVHTLTRAYHVAPAVAKSFALVTHGLKTLLVMLLGLIGYASYYWGMVAWWRRNARK